MCADSTTYSFFRFGSLPGNLAIMLADSTGFLICLVLALIDTASGKRGNCFLSLAISRISLKLWPEPSKSFSAFSGLNVIESFCPAVSSNSAPTRLMLGCRRFTEMRPGNIHGSGIENGDDAHHPGFL